MDLSADDYKNVLNLIETIYSIQDRTTMFLAVCEKLRSLSIIHSAVFAPIDPKTGKYYVDGYEIFNNFEGGVVLYLEHFAMLDPFITSAWYEKGGKNCVVRNTELMPERSLIKSEFACDFLRPMDSIFYILASALVTQGDMVGTCGFHRQKIAGDFSDRDKEIVNLLLPHLARAIRNLDLIQERELSKEQNGVIAIGPDGKPFYMNSAAGLALKGMPVESIPDPGLGTAPAFFKSRTGTFRVRSLPFGKDKIGKVILLEQHPARPMLYSKLLDFPLSRREKEVAALAIQGLSNREIAIRLFISEQTVKDHLHSVFGKLSIRRRSELSAKVLGVQSAPGERTK